MCLPPEHCWVDCSRVWALNRKRICCQQLILIFKSNQIKSLLLSHHHSTSALVSEILMSVLQTVQKKQQTIYIWTDSAKNLHWSIYSAPDSAKKTTTIYIWTVHIYRLYRRQCAKYTYIYSVHIVYYKDSIINTQLSATHYTPYGHIYIMYSIYT